MTIKEKIKKDLKKAIKLSLKIKDLRNMKVNLEHIQNKEYGDYSSNFAMIYSKENNSKKDIKKRKILANKNAMGLARKIAKHFPVNNYLEKINPVEPGFINFYVSNQFLQKQVKEILEKKKNYGLDLRDKARRKNKKVQVEFISANPTGPIHIGNCRGGFAGNTLANVLKKLGYSVEKEYYINDRGKQAEMLGQSIKARYRELSGKEFQIPENGYPGEYIKEIAKKAQQKNIKNFKQFGLKEILKMIKKTTQRMGIEYDSWFSEESLYKSSEVKKVLKLLQQKGLTYKKENALWFKSTKFKDDKDRVLIRSDKNPTYILSDIAYHFNKFEKRKFDKVILFWGADHHGYVPRFMGMIEAIGHKNKAQVKLCQFLLLPRNGKTIKMSKRKGEYITIDKLLDEVDSDAVKFHFLMNSLNRPMTFDLKKVAEKSTKNPVYYVQYAYARICSILNKSKVSSVKIDFSLLKNQSELNLIREIIRFPEILIEIERNYQTQLLPNFSLKIADSFHRFYENCRIINKDKEITKARLALLRATQIILKQTLDLMSISAPQKM